MYPGIYERALVNPGKRHKFSAQVRERGREVEREGREGGREGRREGGREEGKNGEREGNGRSRGGSFLANPSVLLSSFICIM